MALLVWQDDLNTGIEVIDHQHRCIVEMLNRLQAAQRDSARPALAEVIDSLIAYTLSHFAFEEQLMEEAGYAFSRAHKRVHEIFGQRVADYRQRFQAGEDICDELRALLGRWLFNHFRSDDQAYAESVKQHLARFNPPPPRAGWLSRTLDRLFD